MAPRSKYPLRVRHVGTDPVHAAKEHGVKGHATPCLLWLDPAAPHIWCENDAEVTCAKCIERLASEPFECPIPGTVGSLQKRLAEVVENEVPAGYYELAAQRIAEAVENWRRETEERIRQMMDTALVDHIPDTTRTGVACLLTEKVLRGMEVGDGTTSEGTEE